MTELSDILARINSAPKLSFANQHKSFFDEVLGIPGTALASGLELFGIEKSEQQKAYEQKYALGPLIGNLVGFAVPYGAALKGLGLAAKGTGTIAKALQGIDKIGDLAKSPIKTTILRDTAKLGVIEGGRVGISQLIPGGPDIFSDLSESALNLGIGAGISGGLGALRAGGARSAPLQEIFKDIDLEAAPQVQMRQLEEAIAAGTIDPKFSVEARNRVAQLSGQIRTELRPSGTRYVSPTLKSGGKALNRLFDTKGKPMSGVSRRRFAQTHDAGFSSDNAWQGAAQRFGLPENWVQFVQFPRHVTFKSPEAEKSIDRMLRTKLQSAGDGWYVTREANDGLFVMARKVPTKRIDPLTKAEMDSTEWVLFKTDQPGVFRPASEKWRNAVADHMKFLARPARPVGPVSPVYDSARGMLESLPLRKYVDASAKSGSVVDLSKKLASTFGLDDAMKGSGEMTKRVKDFFVQYLAPTVQQFGRSPRAGRLMAVAQATNDAAESIWRKLTFGEKAIDPTKTPFANILFPEQAAVGSGTSLRDLIHNLDEKDVEQFWKLWKEEAGLDAVDEMFARGAISERTRDFAKAVAKIDDDLTEMIIKTEKATGEETFTKKSGHYGLSRSWDGDNRVALRDESDRLVAVAAGVSRSGALREAEKLQRLLAAEGRVTRVAEDFDISQMAGIPKDLRLHVSNPAWKLERQDVRGFKFDDKPFTKDELLEAFSQNVNKRTRYMANKTIVDLLGDDLSRVAMEDPQMHKMLVARLNDLAGVQSAGSKMQNAIVDEVLGPVLGKNTASKLVSTTNKLFWHLELGAMRLAYPLMNMLTFVQTVLPEVAFVRTANENILAKYYTTYSTRGITQAKPLGVLEPMKLWLQGTRQMHSKDPAWMKAVERGYNEGVLDPRFIEDFAGQTGLKAKLSDALKGKGMVGWLEGLSEYLPAQTEKWSRLNSFATAYRVGEDLMGMQGEALYKFAKDFTDRTMFRYGMESRPRLFTTPAGSALGLFKNWMMNYVGMMLDYTAEGAMRKNWAPLAWQTGGTLAVGGATAVPLYAAANAFSEAMTGKSALVNGYDMFAGAPDQVSDGIFFGLPAMLGVSLSGSSQAPLANPMRDATQFFSLVHWDRANAASKAFAGAMDSMDATGRAPFSDANTRDQFLRAFAPKTFYRAAAAAQDGMIKSLSTGYPVLKDVGPVDRFLYTIGFNPTQVEKAYAVADEIWKDQAAMKKRVSAFGEEIAQAYAANDFAAVEEIAQRAIMMGIDLSSIERSAMARLSKAEEDVVTRNADPEAIAARANVLGQ